MKYRNYKWVGLSFAEPFPCIERGGKHISEPNDGPFYAANNVLNWELDTPKQRAYLAQCAEYWRERGYTPKIEETTTKQRY